MLIRFTVKNLLSFGKEKEFNMLPNPKYTRMNEHKYKLNDFNYLKLASIYGANGAGKSNLVKLLELLQEIVIKDDFSINISKKKFKLTNNNDNDSQIFAVEFIQEQRIFYYAIEIKNNIFITEELYETDLLKSNDKLIFERKTTDDGKTTINFSKEFESDKESLVLKSVIENSLVKPQKTILKLLTTLGNRYLEDTKLAFNWFANTLIIISPNSKPVAIAHTFDVDENFREYAKEIMCSFNVGICSIISEKQNLQEFFGSNRPKGLEDIIVKLEETTDNETPGQKIVELRNQNGNEILLVKEKENVLVKQIKLEHIGLDNHKEYFGLDEESDGTIRLLDFIPAFKDIVNGNKVYVIDEIERSIHPLLIKELISKFSKDEKTNGQLIFTTHESNLLDQNIFRQDEIWFIEKDKNGCSDIYSLSDYKEHNTIDIRKGYLSGRYGSIPFLANLHDLNWHKYDSEK